MSEESVLDSPNATVSLEPEFGTVTPQTDDPAWQPPTDPLKKEGLEARASVIHREIPLSVVQTGWAINQVRSANASMVNGEFDAPAQLCDAMTGDSRVISALTSRSTLIMGRPMTFQTPRHLRDSAAAKECRDAWREHWPSTFTEAVMSDMQMWGIMMGAWAGQILWDTRGKIAGKPMWRPYITPFHMRYVYYHWTYRCYVAVTLDGQVPIKPGDGHWMMHCPYGEYRGWMRGAMRAIAPWWLSRNYALRDWARFSERHGMPIGLARVPQGADAVRIKQYRNALQQLGNESILELPTSADPKTGSYDFDWLQTDGKGSEAFKDLIEQDNTEITLAILMQNLTSEVKEGSYAAARVHGNVLQVVCEADARALSHTLYTQLLRPFAAINFGDAELAPRAVWNVKPVEDKKTLAEAFQALGNGANQLRLAGKSVSNLGRLGRRMGFPFQPGDFVNVNPTTVAAKQVTADAAIANSASKQESDSNEAPDDENA